MIAADDLVNDLARLWAPPPSLTASEWADTHFHLSSEYSAEHGKWNTLPFQREPLDSISDPRVSRTVIKAARQMLKSLSVMIAVGYFSHQDPGPILIVQPGGDDADSFSKERIAPMIRDNPVLRKIYAESKTRSSASTINQKQFPGGGLSIVGAGSPRNVARRTIRVICFDEVDKYKPSSEGNVISLGRKCLTTFRHRSKEIDTCTPTVPGSNIDRAYEESDQRQLYIPCPRCGHYQSLIEKFQTQVVWDSKLPTREEQALSARYHCQSCDTPWTDGERMAAVEKGEWRSKKPFAGIAGFWISELYSPWKQLWEIVLDYLTKKDDPQELQTFVNCSLAENWVDKGEAPEWETLINRRDEYPVGSVPQGGLFLVAGADVQREGGGRIEVEIVAYGRNRESWSVDYRILEGNPAEPEVWQKLAAVLAETFPHASGARMPVSHAFVDSGDGTVTNYVYSWVRTQDQQRVTAIKGYEGGANPVGQLSQVDVKRGSGAVDPFGLKIRTVKGSYFKGELFAALKLRPPTPEERDRGYSFPPGYCHFPMGVNYGDEHFKQLTAEQLITRKNSRTGRMVLEWQQTRPRNEALDCRVYARAAAWVCGLDQLQEMDWRALEEQLGVKAQQQRNQPPAPPSSSPRNPPNQPAAEQQPRTGYQDSERSSSRERYIDRKNWFRK